MAPFGISEGGTASVLSVSVASPEESKTIMALFRAGRGREYDEFDERCTALLDEIGNARVPVGVGQALDLDGPSATWNTRGTLGEEPVPDSVARPSPAAHVDGVPVRVRVHRHARQARFPAGPGDPDRDLPPVGDQNLAHTAIFLPAPRRLLAFSCTEFIVTLCKQPGPMSKRSGDRSSFTP